MFWAALTSCSAGPKHVWTKQIALALHWFTAFLNMGSGLITRKVRVDPPNTRPVIAFDASVYGGGAVLWVVPASIQVDAATLRTLKPWAFLAVPWTDVHRRLTGASGQESGDMARWEAFCLLMSITAWEKVIFQSTGNLLAIGDALGMLHGAVRFKSQDPAINVMFMELALLFAPRGATLEAMHLWSEENELADALSRIESDFVIPPSLTQVPRTSWSSPEWRILGKTPSPPRRTKV